MKVEIYGKPMFKFELTREQVAHLQLLATSHYDHHCRSLCTEICVQRSRIADNMEESTVRFDLHFREVDTFAKLVEMRIPHAAMNDWQRKFSYTLYIAMREANSYATVWKRDVITGDFV